MPSNILVEFAQKINHLEKWVRRLESLINRPTVTSSSGTIHDPVTVVDTATVNLTLTGQQLQADLLGGGAGHVIKDEGGAGLTARTNLNFTGVGVTVTDNAGTDSTDVTIPGGAAVGAGGITYGADIYNNANISVPNDQTPSYIFSFNSVRADTGGFYNGANPERLTIPVNGWYVVTGSIFFAPNATGIREIFFKMNAALTTLAVEEENAVTGGFNHRMTIAMVRYFVAGDYVVMGCYQNSGGALNVIYGDKQSPEFTIALLTYENLSALATDPIWDAKGDLVVGTGANTASKLTVGADGKILYADSVEATGLRWGVLPKLDDLSTPDDNTDLNSNTTNHGLLLKAVAPAAGLSTIPAIENGETTWKNKALFDTTNPANLGVASPGTSLIAARRDHVHNTPAGAGHIIKDEGGAGLTQRTYLNFVGATVAATDDAGNDATVITLSAPAGVGDVTGPATNTDNFIPQWNGANSKTLKDGLELVTTIDVTGSDSKVASEQATREALDLKVIAPANNTADLVPQWNGANSKTLKDGLIVAFGTYTPTLYNTTNVSASTAHPCQYMRVGNVVTVSGYVDIDPTAAGAVVLGMTIPIASAIANVYELAGVAANSVGDWPARVSGDAANDRASIVFIAVQTASQPWFFTFTYQVL